LNQVFGSGERGIPYGKIAEASGLQSHGKTALVLELMRYAQRDGAICFWVDLENSWDPEWARLRGVDPDKVIVITQEIDEETEEPYTIEKLCATVEKGVKLARKRYPNAKIFVGVDSIAAMMTDMEANSGLGFNMRVNFSLPMFLGRLLRRWNGFAQTHNALIVFINQLRTKPTAYGDPNYTPGGNAVPFYASIRVRVSRAKGGKIMQGGKQIGIQGFLRNIKNKAGGGSLEGAKCGFKIYFAKESKYFPDKELKNDSSGGADGE
jgi:recombination protein RecA